MTPPAIGSECQPRNHRAGACMSTGDTLGLPSADDVDSIPVDALPALALELLTLLGRIAVRQGQSVGRPCSSDPGPPYTLAEAAKLLHKSPAWLRRQAANGGVPCARKLGRSWLFPRDDFEAFWRRHRRG